MKLNKLYEDTQQFKSIDDVRQAGTKDLGLINKSIEEVTGAMEALIKTVTGGRKELEKLHSDYEQAQDAGDEELKNMVRKHYDIKNSQTGTAKKQYDMHVRYLDALNLKQKQLMKVLDSEQNLEKVFNKVSNPGDITKQSPVDLMLNNMRTASTQPNTAAPADVRGIGRQL